MTVEERNRKVREFKEDKLRIIMLIWFTEGCWEKGATRLYADLVFLCGMPAYASFLGPHAIPDREFEPQFRFVGFFDGRTEGVYYGRLLAPELRETMGYRLTWAEW
jgi:hypothetical protein